MPGEQLHLRLLPPRHDVCRGDRVDAEDLTSLVDGVLIGIDQVQPHEPVVPLGLVDGVRDVGNADVGERVEGTP